jgi:hypothetical protein
VAQAQRRDDAGDAVHRRLRVGRLLRTVVESCPTKLLLANPSMDRRQYAELFQMNEMELDLLAGLMPRQQILLKRPRWPRCSRCGGSEELLDLHEHAHRQRARRAPLANTGSRRASTDWPRLPEGGGVDEIRLFAHRC